MPNVIDTNMLFRQPEYALLIQSMLHNSEMTLRTSNPFEHDINWDYLLDTADIHGLMPLLYLFLEKHHDETPKTILSQLHDRYQANSLRNRILTSELVEVMQLLSTNGIKALTYKGPSLTLLAYDDLSQRQFGDLDILVKAEDVNKASDLLKQRHYSRAIPTLTPRQEEDFIHTAHEHTFISPDQLIHIDLHWSPSNRRFPFQISTDELLQRTQTYLWKERSISHMDVQDLMLILCMHANKDLWRKLVWICDIDRLIRKHDDIDWKLLVHQARQTHCEKMLYMALCIAHDLLNSPIPSAVLKSARKIAPLQQGEKALQNCISDTVPVKTFTECLAIKPLIVSVCDTWTDRIYYIVRMLVTPTECDMMKIRIPPTWHFLYYLFTPVRKLSFCTARFFKRLILNRGQ